jgi:HK97 family phage major capsid protein
MANETFRHFGDLVQALAHAGRGHVDPRFQRAPTGAGETDPSTGGFLVPGAFASEILTTLYADRNSVVPYFRKFNLPDVGNKLSVPGADETSRANGYRWGGLALDYADEGVEVSASWPRLKNTDFDAPKIIGLVPLTNELLSDADNLEAYLSFALADELRYKLEQYSLSAAGTGTNKPLGVMNASALVVAQKTSGQTAGTISYANIVAMWSALPSASRKRAIWAVSESAMAQAVENMPVPVYAASGSPNPDDVPRIHGRPAIETDVLPACGTQGDILLIDPAWYGCASRPIDSALSAHVYFQNDQAVLRVTWRVDAKPLVSAKLTASDGTTRSPFVALQAR